MSTRKGNPNSTPSPSLYSEAFKRQVVQEFESGLYSKASLKRKYGISGNSCLPRWLKKYGKLSHPNYLSKGRPMNDKDKQYIKDLEARLRKREKELEVELRKKDAELLAYKQFIAIAERELNIKITKKSGTKPSKK
jgi:transposase-like protein